ncbi:sensor histidine kinase [Microlunatus sp. GCM10028923]|uniref:sensor histidine kinase n=1 Tax=Microlunatus sp. GCM10028923 TaxID=3273400 RepID=UPI00360FF137
MHLPSWIRRPVAHGPEPDPSATLVAVRVGQHLITVALLVVCTVRAVGLGALPALTVGGALVFLTWYALGPALVRRVRPAAGTWWLAGLVLIWCGLVAASAEFVWLAFLLWLLIGHLLPLRAAVPVGVLVLVVVVGRPWLEFGTPSYAGVIGPLVGGCFAIGLARGVLQLARDAREQRRLVSSLVRANEETARLAEELADSQRIAGGLAERTRLSRDLHDTISQGLSSIVMLSRAGQTAPADQRDGLLGQIEAVACDNLTEARRLVRDLAPASLEDDTLPAALRRLAAELTEQTGTAAEVRADAVRLPMSQQVALLRVAQSALANVRRHAGAGTVRIDLAQTAESVRLRVTDDGVGFEPGPELPPTLQGGYGLSAMRARLAELGGRLDLDSAPGAGCTVTAHLPSTGA